MARPPQYERQEQSWGDADAVRAAVKRLQPEDRARLLAWLALYYDDNGGMYSPQITRRRQRIALNGVEYWLVRVPKRAKPKEVSSWPTCRQTAGANA